MAHSFGGGDFSMDMFGYCAFALAGAAIAACHNLRKRVKELEMKIGKHDEDLISIVNSIEPKGKPAALISGTADTFTDDLKKTEESSPVKANSGIERVAVPAGYG